MFTIRNWIFEQLVEIAAEVFEVHPKTDLESKTNFLVQNSESTHYMDIAVRAVLQRLGLTFKGSELVHINDGGTPLPQNVAQQLGTRASSWFDVFNPSKLKIESSIVPAKALEDLKILTNPCFESWATRPNDHNPLTAESLYQFTRVTWVDTSVSR